MTSNRPTSGGPEACCGTIAAAGTIVTFDHALPAGVAPGHVLTFYGTPATAESFLITAVGPGNQVTILTPAAVAHPGQDYRITSPFKTGNVTPSLAEQHVWIGHGDQQQNVDVEFSPWVGNLDEVRISKLARSANWIATGYANQNSPATFSTAGAPGPAAQTLGTLTTVYRSIGTNAGNLYATGTASLALGGTVVTFAGGAACPRTSARATNSTSPAPRRRPSTSCRATRPPRSRSRPLPRPPMPARPTRSGGPTTPCRAGRTPSPRTSSP